MQLSTSRGSFPCHRLISRQFIIAMKLSCLFLFFCCLHAFSEGYAQRVTIKRKDASLEEVFRVITKQTGYTFVYTKSDIQKARPVSISLQDATLDEALKACFSHQPLTAGVIERHIVVKERIDPVSEPVVASVPLPVDVNISGKVTDASGKPLENVTVQVKGGGSGTTTDAQGNFTLSVPDAKATLVFSSIGYVTRELRLSGTGSVNVTLTESAASMQTVVVTALGIKREQKSLGYATATVPPDQVTVNRSSSFMNALEGKIAGVNITSLGSGPAGTSKIRIRGQSSFGGNNSPLIVVNGVPIDNTNF